MKFEWDDKKNADNIKKHKVSFEQVIGVFSDQMGKEYYDRKHSVYEERYNVIGLSEGRLFFVSFSEPAPETIRIISARTAEKSEMEDYYGNR
jgi:uncharacterized DUF497 family protein